MDKPLQMQELAEGWEFKQTDGDDWMPVARVPTNVHLDLMANNKIPDPFIAFNELKCEWVGETSWTYRTKLPFLPAAEDRQKYVLALDGLDTLATVNLDGKTILQSDNMFTPRRVDVTKVLKKSEASILEIDFAPALLEARKMKDANPSHKWLAWNGETARLAVRKAQYHWGWDWGPVLMTCGPWRGVRLEVYCARVNDLRIEYNIEKDLQEVSGTVSTVVEGNLQEKAVRYLITLGATTVFEGSAEADENGVSKTQFRISKPELWWPHGYGEQALYTIHATVRTNGVDLHTATIETGFRNVELVQDRDDAGRSFFFRINGVEVFCGGSNWIPADSFTPRITSERYRKWLQMMVDGHQVMIRVWGGGIWEEDVFYETCDKLGILVWQDFLFGCGNYPAHLTAFRKSVAMEAVAQVRRLHHHPSIVIYAGNNEDYQLQESNGLTYDYADKDPDNWLKTDFPARYIYEKMLPEIVSEHAGHVPYHPGSPWGDGRITTDPTVGDMHQWNVWHGTQEKYQVYDTIGGRFNSEFGMEAFPAVETIKYFVTDPTQLYPQSQVIDFHNKAGGHERRIATYLVENFRTSTSLETYIYLTQLTQAEALMYAYRGWRKQWGEKRLCGGALVWQLNDCWPVTSWAIVDYFLRKKPAYYTLRRVLAPIAVAIKRSHHDWSEVHARPAKRSEWSCWVASSRTKRVVADVEVRFISIATGKDIKEALVQEHVEIVANGTTDIANGVIDHEKEEPHVLAARIWIDGELIARDVDWPQPLKYLSFEDRGVEVHQSGDKVMVTAQKPTKCLVFEEEDGVKLWDNALDIVPKDEQVFRIDGLGNSKRALRWQYYGR